MIPSSHSCFNLHPKDSSPRGKGKGKTPTLRIASSYLLKERKEILTCQSLDPPTLPTIPPGCRPQTIHCPARPQLPTAPNGRTEKEATPEETPTSWTRTRTRARSSKRSERKVPAWSRRCWRRPLGRLRVLHWIPTTGSQFASNSRVSPFVDKQFEWFIKCREQFHRERSPAPEGGQEASRLPHQEVLQGGSCGSSSVHSGGNPGFLCRFQEVLQADPCQQNLIPSNSEGNVDVELRAGQHPERKHFGSTGHHVSEVESAGTPDRGISSRLGQSGGGLPPGFRQQQSLEWRSESTMQS